MDLMTNKILNYLNNKRNNNNYNYKINLLFLKVKLN